MTEEDNDRSQEVTPTINPIPNKLIALEIPSSSFNMSVTCSAITICKREHAQAVIGHAQVQDGRGGGRLGR